MPAHWWNCPLVEPQGVHLAVARAPHLTPEVGMRTGLCRSGTKVCVVGQELFLSLKMCVLGSAPCTERKEHGSTNILPPGANPPHSGSTSLPGPLFLTPGCCPAFLGRFIVWLLPSHHEPLTGTDLTINTLMMSAFPPSFLPMPGQRAALIAHHCLLPRDHCEDHTCS